MIKFTTESGVRSPLDHCCLNFCVHRNHLETLFKRPGYRVSVWEEKEFWNGVVRLQNNVNGLYIKKWKYYVMYNNFFLKALYSSTSSKLLGKSDNGGSKTTL